jgi:hypothetical protein
MAVMDMTMLVQPFQGAAELPFVSTCFPFDHEILQP